MAVLRLCRWLNLQDAGAVIMPDIDTSMIPPQILAVQRRAKGAQATPPSTGPSMSLPPGITAFDLLAGPKGLAAAVGRERSRQQTEDFQQQMLKERQGFEAGLRKESEDFQTALRKQSSADSWARLMQSENFQRGKQSYKLVPTRDADGHPISVWYDPTTGQPVQGLSPIKGRLSANELSGLEATKSLQLDIPKLQQAVQGIAGGSPAKLAMEYRKYAFPMFGMGGVTDPAYQEYFAQIGNIKSELARLQSSGSSRSFQLLKFIQDHIPRETDAPQVALHKLSTLERGRFDSLTKSILGGEGVTPTESPSPAATMPPASLIPEGMRRQFSNGKWYQNRGGVITEVTP